ncbi:MAG: hypothetical protein HRU25_16640 [Psychrobium sp.]|nr:hypothetical protein [Psychrobium sp.]
MGKRGDLPDIYNTIDKACSDERAFLFVADDGFIVLRPRCRQHDEFIELTIAHCTGGNALKRYQDELISLSSVGNAKYIEFLTARKGFEKLAPAFGWVNHGDYKSLTRWRYQLER